MVTHMKTTIDIADDLLNKAKRQARREKRTLREIIEEALRKQLAAERTLEAFRLKPRAFKGKGLQSPLVEGDWTSLRDLIYRLK
jgi:hypothetical protein